MPTMNTDRANTPSTGTVAAVTMAAAHHAAATTRAPRSPNRVVITVAGTLVTSEPMPVSVMISAASGTEAPRSRAVRAMTGRMAPVASPYSSVGP